jgi:hypothetical protein
LHFEAGVCKTKASAVADGTADFDGWSGEVARHLGHLVDGAEGGSRRVVGVLRQHHPGELPGQIDVRLLQRMWADFAQPPVARRRDHRLSRGLGLGIDVARELRKAVGIDEVGEGEPVERPGAAVLPAMRE